MNKKRDAELTLIQETILCLLQKNAEGLHIGSIMHMIPEKIPAAIDELLQEKKIQLTRSNEGIVRLTEEHILSEKIGGTSPI